MAGAPLHIQLVPPCAPTMLSLPPHEPVKEPTTAQTTLPLEPSLPGTSPTDVPDGFDEPQQAAAVFCAWRLPPAGWAACRCRPRPESRRALVFCLEPKTQRRELLESSARRRRLPVKPSDATKSVGDQLRDDQLNSGRPALFAAPIPRRPAGRAAVRRAPRSARRLVPGSCGMARQGRPLTVDRHLR